MTMPVLAIQQNNNGTALQEFFRTVQLDAENKVPSEALRIVGALSAGHIIESGDNANGNYVRFADGTQVCWIYNKEDVGAIRYATFPASFISNPAIAFVAGTNSPSSSGFNTMFFNASITPTEFSYKVEHNNAIYTAISGLAYIAIGKWK